MMNNSNISLVNWTSDYFNGGIVEWYNESKYTFADFYPLENWRHWHKFPPVSRGVHITVGIFISIVSVLSLFGNALSLYVLVRFNKIFSTSASEGRKYEAAHSKKSLCRFKARGSWSHLFLMSLTVADISATALSHVLYIASSFAGKWLFHKTGCGYYAFTGGLFGFASINTMAAITVDRYYVIVKQRTISRSKALTLLIFSWSYAFICMLPPFFGWGRFVPEGAGTMCSFDYISRDTLNRSYIVFIYIFQFVGPLSVMTGLYIIVFVKVRQHVKYIKGLTKRKQMSIHSGSTHMKSKSMRYDIEVAKTAIYLIFVFCVSWSPYATVALIGQFGDSSLITPMVSIIPGVIAKCSTVYNPIIYCIKLPRFKMWCSRCFPFFCKKQVFYTPGPSNDISKGLPTSRRVSGGRLTCSSAS